MPGSGRAPGERNGSHSSFLAWRIPWTEEPGGLHSMGSQRVGQDWLTHTHTHTRTEIISLFHLLNTQAKSDSLPVFSLELLCRLRRVKHEVGGHNTARQHPRRSQTPALCIREGPCDLAKEMWTEMRGPLQAKTWKAFSKKGQRVSHLGSAGHTGLPLQL